MQHLRLPAKKRRGFPPARFRFFGGVNVFAEILPRAERMYYTEVHARPDGDTLFPPFDRAEWQEVARTGPLQGPKDQYSYSFVTLERKRARSITCKEGPGRGRALPGAGPISSGGGRAGNSAGGRRNLGRPPRQRYIGWHDGRRRNGGGRCPSSLCIWPHRLRRSALTSARVSMLRLGSLSGPRKCAPPLRRAPDSFPMLQPQARPRHRVRAWQDRASPPS